MSRESQAELDRQAADYWRSVARVDRSEARYASSVARNLTDAAQREEQAPRRHRGARLP